MVKRVCDGSIALDDYGGQKLEVVNLVGTGSFTCRIDQLFFFFKICPPTQTSGI